MMRPHGVLETCLYTTDLAAAERFYGGVLGFEVFQRQDGRNVFFWASDHAVLLLFNPDYTSTQEHTVNGGTIPLHGSRGPGHVAFAIRTSEIDAWRERLRSHGIAIESEVDWPQGGHSIYFRDPADNAVELASPKIWNLPEP